MKFLRWLDEHFEETILVVLLVVINFVMLAQIVARYILNDSMSWPEEFSRYCYVWTVFLSISYSIAKGNMLRVGVVMDLLPAKAQSTIRILCNLIMLALFWVFFRHSVSVVGHIKNVTHEISSAMRIPMWLVYMATLVGFGLAIARMVQTLFKNICHFNEKAETTIQATLKEAQAETKLASQDDKNYRHVEGGAE
ncbi:MAG: TRAP transporter small permease [Synergistaceae bacterium]|nr:TRAP transporter small permease [Synergistaceae bacterium]